MAKNLLILIVLYKKNHKDSAAIQSLLLKTFKQRQLGSVSIHIWNNSPGYSDVLEDVGVFWHEGNNVFLPKIYNEISELFLLNDGDNLMISDDDTDYSSYDFDKLTSILEIFSGKSESIGCFLPVVKSNNQIVSPGKRLFFKGKRLSKVDAGIRLSKNLLAINSGMIFNHDCLLKMKKIYSEELRFYGTDSDFCIRYECFFDYYYILPFELDHNLSENSNESVDRAYFRWSDHFYATRFSFRNCGISIKILLFLYIYIMRIKLSLRYKSIKFLRI